MVVATLGTLHLLSQLAGVTAALALRETKIWLVGGIQHELQKEKQRRVGIEIEVVLMVLTSHMAGTYAEIDLLLFA